MILFASVPFLHAVGDRDLHAIVRLEGNLPTLAAAARTRFEGTAPLLSITAGADRVDCVTAGWYVRRLSDNGHCFAQDLGEAGPCGQTSSFPREPT